MIESTEGEWVPTRWWRVIRDDDLWCETSRESEARAAWREGDKLQRIYRYVVEEWRDEEPS